MHVVRAEHCERRQRQWVRLTIVCLCCLLIVSACQNSPSKATTVGGASETGTAPITLQIPRQSVGSTVTPGAYNPGSPPGTVPSGSGSIPAIFPHYFSFGVMNAPGAASALDAQRSQNGTAYTFRYQYLSGGVNTNHGWEVWNAPAGQFATNYMQESLQHRYTPTFVYYEICQSNGVQPGSYCYGHDMQQDTANIKNPAVMKAYFANWTLLMQKIAAYGKPVLVVVEPDLWGFLEQAANGGNATKIPASVKSSGNADASAFPDTAQGFAWALLHIRDKYARNATLALHASTWAAGDDIASSTNPTLNVASIAKNEAAFLNSAGLVGNPSGVSSWDLLSNDVADHDSGQPGGRSWWDRYNRTFPNFARYLTYIGLLSADVHRRVVMWQVPMGNQYFDTLNDSAGHYQDNRAEYILNNVTSFAHTGVIAVLFGPGNGGTMNIDTMGDGITNPAPIGTYECNFCNTHKSSYPDDDGGYLRLFVGQYMRHPVPIS
ncbi:MAG TPA: hypothetical protein VKR42_09790 [Ktedonobacteraceae bacterium]|nr:hypothetical protein [Ktedonobacteraceae bacterium]